MWYLPPQGSKALRSIAFNANVQAVEFQLLLAQRFKRMTPLKKKLSEHASKKDGDFFETDPKCRYAVTKKKDLVKVLQKDNSKPSLLCLFFGLLC